MPFAKHESFYIREGWLYKGLNAIAADPTAFVASDAPERLGLGKNMVRALRFWMQATNLAKEASVNRVRQQHLTPLGQIILSNDPYLELDGTLWLLHHQLVSSKDQATSWYWFFNFFAPTTFSRQEFLVRLSQWVNLQSTDADDGDEAVAAGSLRKDFDCFMHTYLSDSDERESSPEDQIMCPLTSLGLLSGFRAHDDDAERTVQRFRLESGLTKNIPPLVFLYVLLKRQEEERPNQEQVGLNVALREPMNVGRTFNIGMRAFEELAAQLENYDTTYRLQLVRTAGLDQITLPDAKADDVLEEYFTRQAALEDNY